MRFTKIKFAEKGGVELAWTVTNATGTEAVQFTSSDRPMADLPKSLAAFKPFVADLIGAPESWQDELTVTTLSISESADKRRGLIVTATRKIKRAANRPLVINTPLMNEAGENTSEEASGIFDDEISALIAAAEKAATRYHAGEREQVDAFEDTEKPAPQTDAEKPKAKRTKGRKIGDGQFVEASDPKGVPLTDDLLRSKLLDVGRDVPIDAVARWTASERDTAAKWAEGLKAGTKAELPPLCVQRDGTPSLLETAADRAD